MPYTYAATDLVEILILGAGWTSQFLVPLLESKDLPYALTTPTGTINKFCVGKYDDSKIIQFHFKPDDDDPSEYLTLPTAATVIVTFPLKDAESVNKLMDTYINIHAGFIETHWILLGSSSIYQGNKKHDRSSLVTPSPRSIAEDILLSRGGVVLNLAGLWGGERQPKNWPKRAITSKSQLKEKGSLHLIHGEDVAQACVAVHNKFYPRSRYLLTDRSTYDWWFLLRKWELALEAESVADGGVRPYRRWLAEAMQEENVKSLPRPLEQLGRVLDSDYFWRELKIEPKHTLS